MPSHVHMIIGSNKNKLEDIVRDMKSFTSTALKKAIKENVQESRKEWIMWMMERAGKKNGNNNGWQFWQQHNKPLEIKDQTMFDTSLEYIHLNPVMAGFVMKPEDWKYSSARDFSGLKGLIELNLVNMVMAQADACANKGAVGDSFMTKLFDVKGQWTVTETANGYTFNRVDTILQDEKKTKKNVQ